MTTLLSRVMTVTVEQFLEAAKGGDEATVQRALEQHPPVDINTADPVGQTVLHWAVRKKHARVVSLLLAHPPIRMDARSAVGSAALHDAANYNAGAAIIEELLEHKADITATNNYGWTVLHFVIRRIGTGKWDHYATEAEAIEWLRFWLDRGAHVCLTVKNQYGRTPADYAKQYSVPEVATFLQQYKHTPKPQQDGQNVATLSNCHIPQHSQLQDRVSELEARVLALGDSKTEAETKRNQTRVPEVTTVTAQLLEAAKAGDEAAVQRALEQHPPVTVDEDGNSVLHNAVWKKHARVVSLLLAHPPPNAICVDARNRWGWTPLHDAADYNAGAAIIEELLAHKADITATNNYGFTVLHCVIDRTGTSGLDRYKMEAEATEWLRFWLDRGAHACLAVKDQYGRTPADHANARKKLKVAAFLQQYKHTPNPQQHEQIVEALSHCHIPQHSQLQGHVSELEARVLALQLELDTAQDKLNQNLQSPVSPLSSVAVATDTGPPSAATLAEMKSLAEERDLALAEQQHKQQQLSELEAQLAVLKIKQHQLESDKNQQAERHRSELSSVQQELVSVRAEMARREQELAIVSRILSDKTRDLAEQQRQAEARITALRGEVQTAQLVSDRAVESSRRAQQRESEAQSQLEQAQKRLAEAQDLKTQFDRVVKVVTESIADSSRTLKDDVSRLGEQLGQQVHNVEAKVDRHSTHQGLAVHAALVTVAQTAAVAAVSAVSAVSAVTAAQSQQQQQPQPQPARIPKGVPGWSDGDSGMAFASAMVEVKSMEELYEALDVALTDSVNGFLSRLLTRCPRDPSLHSLVDNEPPKTLNQRKLLLKKWLIGIAHSLPFDRIAQAWIGPRDGGSSCSTQCN